MRRLRQRKIRPLLAEHSVRKEDLVMPLFVDETATAPVPIGSMPGQFRYPLSDIPAVAKKLFDAGIRAVLLFGIPEEKDDQASQAYHGGGIVQAAVRSIQTAVPDMVIITDVCACEYTSHGHCGIVGSGRNGPDVQNDLSLDLMARIAVSHAEAGADIVAPSCMLDGMVGTIRSALDENGFSEVLIMSYSTKFSSAMYGPFREAADSGFSFGDRSTYQTPSLQCTGGPDGVPARCRGRGRYPDGQARGPLSRHGRGDQRVRSSCRRLPGERGVLSRSRPRVNGVG